MNYYSEKIDRLIEQLGGLPGIGNKSAQRLAFHILNMPKERVRALTDTITDARENVRYCKSHHIHLNGPKLGRPTRDPEVRKAELLLEWLESGERGDIERRIGIGKRTTSLGLIPAKLEHTSEVMAYTSVLMMNLQKRLRLLLRLLVALFRPARAVRALCR